MKFNLNSHGGKCYYSEIAFPIVQMPLSSIFICVSVFSLDVSSKMILGTIK